MKNKKGLLLLTAVIVIVCVSVVIYAGKSGEEDVGNNSSVVDINNETEQKTGEAAGAESDKKDEDVIVLSEGEALIIPVSEVSTTAAFYKVEIDGTTMEIIAVKGSDGNIRTAFNTCQICYDSGRGYYVQKDDVFICQNCGNRFTVDDIEIEAGGCNPWPIFEEDKSVTDEAVEISYDYLSEAKAIFANWKR